MQHHTKLPAGYKVIDGTNKFLMPGLWEMHGHFFMGDGPVDDCTGRHQPSGYG